MKGIINNKSLVIKLIH